MCTSLRIILMQGQIDSLPFQSKLSKVMAYLFKFFSQFIWVRIKVTESDWYNKITKRHVLHCLSLLPVLSIQWLIPIAQFSSRPNGGIYICLSAHFSLLSSVYNNIPEVLYNILQEKSWPSLRLKAPMIYKDRQCLVPKPWLSPF